MTSKELVMSALEFKGDNKIPVDAWILPAARLEYGDKLAALEKQYPTDIVSVTGPHDHGYTPEYYEIGTFIDPWGSQWNNLQAGIIGEVKKPVFCDYELLKGYTSPKQAFISLWETDRKKIANKIKAARQNEKFVIGGWISLFERMQYLRGTEELYCDIALEDEEMFSMAEIVMDYMHVYVDKWLEMDIDAMVFGDDWGTQINLLISPIAWRKIFKPMYSQLIEKIKAKGKKVFFHSDGYILDLYNDFIEMGVDAINSQLWCMGVEKVAQLYAGKITFWGEISRQTTLPNGTVEEVLKAAKTMKEFLHKNGGGLIGQSEFNRDVPLENIKAFYSAWNEEN